MYKITLEIIIYKSFKRVPIMLRMHGQSNLKSQIDNCHYRLILKLGKEMQINHHSKKEHTKMSKIAKFGCEML
jgi:hypothetical protein